MSSMSKTMALALLLALALAPSAWAKERVLAPPGLPEAEEYFETVPTSTGPRAPDPSKKARDAVRDGALSEASEQALRKRGPNGLSLADAVAATAPGDTPENARRAPTLVSLTEPGLGAGFPLMLVLAAVAAAAFFVSRRRGLFSR
jgi:hypothetical protein